MRVSFVEALLPSRWDPNWWVNEAPPNCSLKVRKVIDQKVPRRWNGRRDRIILWPPRSLDMTPLNFLLGYVKNILSLATKHSTEELKCRIVKAILNVNPAMLH
ncbi:hypothetical protein TNCV_2552721 [Trichonephila clavipes]|nr:hypothetical protein TNCV_2552721 [Trichonephila clavipes]